MIVTEGPHERQTIARGRAWLVANRDVGAVCPCCDQLVRVYRRRITSGMARSLIALFRAHGRDFGHMPSVRGVTRDAAQLQWWGLIEEPEGSVRDDGGSRGVWRVTWDGERFLTEGLLIVRYKHVLDGRVIAESGPLTGIGTALGSRFSLAVLMGWETGGAD